jgi:glycerophosphoryl diester phosphodiesterase
VFVVAHRTPATPAACAALVEAGVSCFELDIQLSARGVVVSHFLPLLGVRGWIENDNWRFRWRSARDPLVSEVLACIPDGVDVLLDPKETEASRRADLVRRVAELPDRERYVVSTSALDDLVAYRAAGLRTWRTLKNVRQLRAALRSGPLEDEGVSVRHALLDARTLNQLHAVVPSVVGWTVNDLDRARSLYQWGIDGITTDRAEEITRISR